MPAQTTLLLGGTGRTGGRVLNFLLKRDVAVRAIVRSAQRLPQELIASHRLEIIEADLLSMPQEVFAGHLRGCDAVVSCLGHNLSFKGVFAPPYALVTRAAQRVCRAARTLRPASPLRFVLMSSVSVHRPGGLDALRSSREKAFLWVLRGVLPPAMDNQNAADFLQKNIGPEDPFIRWVAVRPDSLKGGEVTPYTIHEGLVASLFKPDQTNMANVADFMAALVTDRKVWQRWESKLPVIVNA